MNTNARSSSAPYLGEVKITTVLRVEHRLLRVMIEAMSDWLSKAPPSASAEMRECVALLAVALEIHALREEEHPFAQLRPRSERARHLVDMMVIVQPD
jgi:hypothetical protein